MARFTMEIPEFSQPFHRKIFFEYFAEKNLKISKLSSKFTT